MIANIWADWIGPIAFGLVLGVTLGFLDKFPYRKRPRR